MSLHHRVNLALAYSDARLYGTPMCPVKPTAVITHQGETYAVEQHSYSGLSKTEKYWLTITRHATGKSLSYNVVRKYRQSKKTGHTTYHVNLVGFRGIKGWSNWDAAFAAVVAMAAPRLADTLTLTNPITGSVQVPVRIGGAA